MFVPLQISQKEIDKLKYYVGNLSLPEIEKEQDEFYREYCRKSQRMVLLMAVTSRNLPFRLPMQIMMCLFLIHIMMKMPHCIFMPT